MKVDFNAGLQTIYETPLTENAPDPKDPNKNVSQPVTLKAVCRSALLGDNSPDMSAKDKLDRYELALKIHRTNGELLEITVEQAALLQRLINTTYPPLIVGQCLPLLEG
jgi:hypothetical protein